MAQSKNPSFRKLTGKQQYRVHQTIMENAEVEITADGDLVGYEEGWNDERVAVEALPDVPAEKRGQLVRAYRLREIGKLRPRAPAPRPADLDPAADLADLAALKAWALDVASSLGIAPPAFAS